MSDVHYTSLSTRKTRMVLVSLFVAIVAGGLLFAAGSGGLAVGGVIATALVCSLICTRYLATAIAEIRADQARVVASLQLSEDVSSVYAEQDDVKVITSFDKIIIKTVETRRKERQHLLNQIIAAEEQLKQIIHNMITGDNQEVAQVGNAVIAMESMKAAFSKVIDEIDELSGRTEERASISTEMSATTDAIAENINQYSSFVIETSSSIEEMAHAAKETADNIRGLSISTEQTAAAIHQISASQSNVRENSERGAAASGSVRDQAQQGLSSMAATMKAMQEIVKSTDESFASINRLSRYSARVGEFLVVIQEVVEQTNLLSLNASIIAAQAGERGKAFAVVAEEVRSLARRTSASTKEIEELVRNIQSETASVQRSVTLGRDKVTEGVKISSRANEALDIIDKSAEEASRVVANIASETAEQSVDIQRITEASEKNLERVRQITQATEQQQDATNQILKNLEHMRELAHRINSSAQEQAKGNRLYLKSVLEDNDRTRAIKEEASGHIAVVDQAVEAVQKVNALISSNAADSMQILEGVKTLTRLIDHYRTGTVLANQADAQSHEK
ncbi:MAG: methyl-accepting chemotaxis protein [Desulfobacteraceae bacterium]|nr:methyl-accepting chemotaxis protein [Desulfobacteraceae bacterium]